MAVYTLIVACLVTAARSHGRLTKPMSRKGPGYENDPVPGYDSEAFVCRNAAKNPSIETTEIAAGAELTLQWDFGAAHVGDCAVYISYDVSSSRVAQKFLKIANLPRCKDQNRQDITISIPDFLPGGDAILRWDWYALHVFPTVEFYTQCVDVKITSTSSVQVNQLETYSIINPAVYPANGNSGKGFRNPFGNGEQYMTGPACAHGYTGNNCGLTAVGTRGCTREGGSILSGGGSGGEVTTTEGVTVSLTPLCEIYTVVAGDTLSSIASKYSAEGKAVTWQQICVANSKVDCNEIDIGDNYIIPYEGSACVAVGETTTAESLATTSAMPVPATTTTMQAATTESVTASQPQICEIYSTVAGDSLSTIADKYASQCQGITRETICANANVDCGQCSPSVRQICDVTSKFVQQICAAAPTLPPIATPTDCKQCSECVAIPGNSDATTDAQCAPCALGRQSWHPCNEEGLCQCAGGISSQSVDIGSSTGDSTDLGGSLSGACMLLLSPLTVFALAAGNCIDRIP